MGSEIFGDGLLGSECDVVVCRCVWGGRKIDGELRC